MTAATAQGPQLSVVLVAGSGWPGITRTLEHLCAQTVREHLEVVVVGTTEVAERMRAFDHPFLAFRLVAMAHVTQRGEAAAAGVESAVAPLVGLIEDHSFPAPTWAEGLIAAHDGPWRGVGPCVGNANPATATSWVNFLLSYGAMSPLSAPGPRALIPWHNSTYKRGALEPYRGRLAPLLDYEGRLQEAIVASGGQLYLSTAIRTDHLNVSRARSSMRLNLHRGRMMGGLRSAREQWTALRRITHACLFPVYPFFQWRALRTHLRSLPIPAALQSRVRVILAATLGVMALGEALGVVAGVGHGVERLEDFELHRARHLARGERDIMSTHASARPLEAAP